MADQQTQKEEKKFTKAQADNLRAELLTRAQSRIDGKEACVEAYLDEARTIRQAYHDGESIKNLVVRFGTMAVAGALGAIVFEYAVKPGALAVVEWFKS